jgi:hypothetical protein
VAIGIFIYKESGKAMDRFCQGTMGLLKIGLALYIAYISHPPLVEAAIRAVSAISI